MFLLLLSCQNTSKPAVSFYYWKTVFKLTKLEKCILRENKVNRIYIRYFDVDIKEGVPFPISPIIFEEKLKKIDIVPVIFIKNEVMLNNEVDLNDLGHKIRNLIDQINEKNRIVCKEIQLDCDWTMLSKENYLKFVNAFRNNYKGTLSATIRLHQIKFFKKTGIPNVDKGVLMFYNMGKIAQGKVNSIYDRNIGKDYTNSLKDYPLPLDIALPIYSWGVHIRNNELIELISKLDVNTFKNDRNFERLDAQYFKTKKSTLKSGYFFKKDDIIKIESISRDNLFEIANDLKRSAKKRPDEIIFYDLDDFNLKPYSNDKKTFKGVTNSF